MLYAPALTFSFASLRGFTRSNPVVFSGSHKGLPLPLNGLNSPFRLRQAPRFTPFSPNGFPARKAYSAGLKHHKNKKTL
ncbi:MAG: hypothetical protein LBL79_15310 [Prevotella sp.]|nr:hypothetical protein [Prevotella sp.]